MKLSRLIKNIPIDEVHGSKHIEITGISSNSKSVGPGNLFIAKRGLNKHGNDYISEAISAGALAVVTDIYNPSLKGITQLICSDIPSLESAFVANYYEYPAEELLMVGITGTKGKTTTSYCVQHLLQTLHLKCGMLGTVEYVVGTHRYPASLTTPDLVTNYRMFREMVLQGCEACVMEVSSIGLVQKRVERVNYDIVVFTNITPDHLDYHQTFEDYLQAKTLLFRQIDPEKIKARKWPKMAIVNRDCPESKRMVDACKAPIMTYGLSDQADVYASNVELDDLGVSFILSYRNESLPCRISLLGMHNLYNALAAASVALTARFSLSDVVFALQTFQSAPGRLEMVPNPQGLKVYVDFAHTEESLGQVLQCLQGVKRGRIITVFGAGGDRDPGRRTGMARAVEKFADVAVITSDNPRSEDPQKIIEDILKGFHSLDKVTTEIDRQKAIEKAISMADQEDIVLIAGKGHEKTQIFAHRTIEFDDCKVAREACEKRS